jgi:hypothetical protein
MMGGERLSNVNSLLLDPAASREDKAVREAVTLTFARVQSKSKTTALKNSD